MFSKTGYLILLSLIHTQYFNITRVAFVCLVGLIITFHIYVLIEINYKQANIITEFLEKVEKLRKKYTNFV